jgi:hypothetical protein
MPEIGGKIAGSGYNLWDFLAIGVSKRITETTLTPMIGNGTLKSGGLKLAGAFVGDMLRPKGAGMLGKVSEYVVAGLVIDGVEDVTLALLGTNPFGLVKDTSDAQTGVVYV